MNAEKPTDEIVIKLRVDESLNERINPTGWSLCDLDGGKQAVFSPKGKPDFSLKYDSQLRTITISVRKALDGFVRAGVLYGILVALSKTRVGFHGVTLQCDGETIILSAPSGTGKTTLANLLVKHCNARIINGDFALLSLSKEGVLFEPTPFCGTSGVCLNEWARIDRIVFLSQSRENIWHKMNGRQSFLNMSHNAFVPTFDDQLQQNIQNNIARILSNVRISGFGFAPTGEAAKMFLERIRQR